MIKEKRKHPRKEAEIKPGEFFTIKICEVLRKLGDIKNLSEGGVAVETDNDFHVGDEIFISFEVPGESRKVDGLGKVVRAADNTLGIQFLKMNMGAKTFINGFIKKELA